MLTAVGKTSYKAFISYSHRDRIWGAWLQRALETARTLTAGRVIAVFGSAGLRDVQKRAWMGEIGGRLADVTLLTAEDPRTESLEAILDEMDAIRVIRPARRS